MTTPPAGRRFTKPWRRRRLAPYQVLLLGVGAVVLICTLALCGMSLNGFGKPGQPDGANPAPGAPAGGPPPTAPASGQSAAPPPATPADRNSAIMPNLVGLNAAVAGDQLKRLGFTKVQYASGDKRYRLVIVPANWSVTAQSAPANTSQPKSALIVLTCVKP